jgi:hypothetical protein
MADQTIGQNPTTEEPYDDSWEKSIERAVASANRNSLIAMGAAGLVGVFAVAIQARAITQIGNKVNQMDQYLGGTVHPFITGRQPSQAQTIRSEESMASTEAEADVLPPYDPGEREAPEWVKEQLAGRHEDPNAGETLG